MIYKAQFYGDAVSFYIVWRFFLLDLMTLASLLHMKANWPTSEHSFSYWHIPRWNLTFGAGEGELSYMTTNFIYWSLSTFKFSQLLLTPRLTLTFWWRTFFQILAHTVFKMWVIQKPNKVALWNKRHFEEKKWRLYSMFKIFSRDICWINIKWGIYRVILRPSYIWDARFLKVNVGTAKCKQN